jgi:hypothetical protein
MPLRSKEAEDFKPHLLLAFQLSEARYCVRRVSAFPAALGERSDTEELADSVLLDRLGGKPQVHWLNAIDLDSYKGTHRRLRRPVPDHPAPIGVSALTHGLTRGIVI